MVGPKGGITPCPPLNTPLTAANQFCFQLLMSWYVPAICATKHWSCSKLRAQPILGRSTSASITFFVSKQFTNFSFSNTAGIALDEVCVTLSISWPILEIFAVKVESCPKSHRILDASCLPNFKGAVPPNVVYKW